MAVGKHWEWRGFGQLDTPVAQRIRRLPSLLDAEWQVTDHYLWAPACTVNVKLRGNDLKLKRFLAAAEGLEQWLEDETELFPFPLAPALVPELAHMLGVTLPHLPQTPLDQSRLLALLLSASPPVRLITVAKRRWLYRLDAAGDVRFEPGVLVELTEISFPERVTTVALEHPQAPPVHSARQALGLVAANLRTCNYLQALQLWAEGQRMFARP